METKDYGCLFTPIGRVQIRSKFWFTVIAIFAIISELGLIASPFSELYGKLIYTTMIISPEVATRKVPQGAEVEVKSSWNDEGGEVVLEFSDAKFEIRYTTRNVHGMVPFSVEKFETTLNKRGGAHQQRHQNDLGRRGAAGQYSGGGEG